MGKPSIFSREYEKRMKKRRRNIIITLLVIIIAIGLISVKFIYNPIDFNNIKQNIQAWIDSDTPGSVNTNNQEEVVNEESEDKTIEEEKEIDEQSKNSSIDILVNGKTLKGIYVEENNEKKFIDVEGVDESIDFDINPSGNKLLIMGDDSNIVEYDTEGNSRIVTKDKYVSTKNGSVFEKNTVMQNTPNYLWNNTPKFLTDSKIIFVTNRPYFGTAAVKQYLWITDTESGTDTVLWNLASNNIEINGIEEGKMKVTIDGKIIYLDENGNKIQ